MRRLRIRENDKRLPAGYYRNHLQHFPMVTVDLVVTNRQSQFLLVRRNSSNLNWKGVWATPGGRVYRNEMIREAASRILQRETGVCVRPNSFSFRGVEEILTNKEHGVTLIFSVRSNQKAFLTDKTSSSIRWFYSQEAPKSLKREYRSILAKGGARLRGTGSSMRVTNASVAHA